MYLLGKDLRKWKINNQNDDVTLKGTVQFLPEY